MFCVITIIVDNALLLVAETTQAEASCMCTCTPKQNETCTVNTTNFHLSAPVYQSYNRITTVCSYLPGTFTGKLRYTLNDSTNSSCIPPLGEAKNLSNGCGTITVSSTMPTFNWTFSVVLLNCDHVLLRCGHKTANCSDEFSSPVNMIALKSKAFVCSCVLLLHVRGTLVALCSEHTHAHTQNSNTQWSFNTQTKIVIITQNHAHVNEAIIYCIVYLRHTDGTSAAASIGISLITLALGLSAVSA